MGIVQDQYLGWCRCGADIEVCPVVHYGYSFTHSIFAYVRPTPGSARALEETARMLCIAGSWLKVKDPNEADRFYKALVLRCRKTKLGQEANKLRWFPKIEMSAKKLLEETP